MQNSNVRFELKAYLLDDLHSGAGTGAGVVDAQQIRDRKGYPVIRASHLKGLLLLAAEELESLERLDAVDRAAVRDLLGATGGKRGQLQLAPLRMDPVSSAKTLNWTSSARDTGSRRSCDDTLRVIEHVPAGNTFTALLSLPNDEKLKALLKRLLKRIDRIGGSRSRGSGRVCFELAEVQPATRPVVQIRNTVVRVCLKAIDAICLPETGHPGNLIRSQAFIRGQTIRGSLFHWALSSGQQNALSMLELASFGDALPLPSEPTLDSLATLQILPIPLSVMSGKPKGTQGQLPWWADDNAPAAPSHDALAPDPRPLGEKPKRPAANDFIFRRDKDSSWSRFSPLLRVHMRNQSADVYTQPNDNKQETQLYSIEEIVEDTCFVADIRFATPEATKLFITEFSPILLGGQWLGVGRGARPVEVVSMCEPLPDGKANEGDNSDRFTLTLTSDLIVRGQNLGFLDNLDIGQLCRLAGLEVKAPKLDLSGWTLRGYFETTQIHGFNAATGLRRVPALGIRRGSCWEVAGPGSEKLAQALSQHDALGERQDEGFGRFVIDLHPVELDASPLELPDIPQRPLETILARARSLADHPGCRGLSPSQLQAMRAKALACNTESELADVLGSFKKAPERRPRSAHGWAHFPFQELIELRDEFKTIDEQRQLVSAIVQWIALSPNGGQKQEERNA